MIAYIIKYSIYFQKTELHQKGEIEIEDGYSFRDIEERAIIIIDSDDAVNYVGYLYEKNINNLIKVHQKFQITMLI